MMGDMKRNTILIIVGALLLAGALAWAAFFRGEEGGPALTREERDIQREIDKANHCETTADCAQAAAAVCPFGCYVHVHKDEAERIGKLISAHQSTSGPSTCVYSCIEYPGVDCILGKCQLRQP